MGVLNIMDRTGHSAVDFDKADKVSTKAAMDRFNELLGKGHVAWKPGPNGDKGELIRAFDPEAEVINMRPMLQGG